MNELSAVLSGFSAVTCFILCIVYLFSLPEMQKTILGKITCLALMSTLALVQLAHVHFFFSGVDLLGSRYYLLLLSLVPVTFYFFFRELLFHGSHPGMRDAVHLSPLVSALVLPNYWAAVVIFIAGCGYTLNVYRKVLKLRMLIPRFKFERFFLTLFFGMTLLALALGLALPVIDPLLFYHAYAACLSVAMMLVLSALLVFPELLSDVTLASEVVYSKSKLGRVNVAEKREQLQRLMLEEQIYENDDLSLNTVAEQLGLTGHQLSELVNSSFSLSFPRYVRHHRIEAAKRMLLAEPDASVLSIGLATGFKSQSSFYTAFRDLAGQAPAAYRNAHRNT